MLSVFLFLLSEHTLFKDSGEKPCSHRNKVSLLDSEQEGEFVRPVQDPRDGFGDYHSSSPERSQQRSQQP